MKFLNQTNPKTISGIHSNSYIVMTPGADEFERGPSYTPGV